MEDDRSVEGSLLLVGQPVEVRRAGNRVCWYPAKVVEVQPGIRVVEFEPGVRESVPFGSLLRPCPPVCSSPRREDWQKGLRIDAYMDSWREGVLLEPPGIASTQAQVLFPDDGEKQDVSIGSIRVSQEWNESRNSWIVRGYESSSDCIQDSKNLKTYQRKRKRKPDGTEGESIKRERHIENGFTPSVPAPESAMTEVAIQASQEPLGFREGYIQVEVPTQEELENKAQSEPLRNPVCCINTQAQDALFTDDMDGERNDSSSQGSFSKDDTDAGSGKRKNISADFSRRGDTLKDARMNAIRNLEEFGWTKGYRARQRENRTSMEAYYIAPDGTSYHSLTSACSAWMLQNTNVPKSIRDAMRSYQMQIVFRRKFGADFPETNGSADPAAKKKMRVARRADSSKKMRTGESPKNGRPRLNALLLARKSEKDGVDERSTKRTTIFSWLVDLGVVKENETVSYLNKDDSKGSLTRDGILCGCCKNIFSVQNFEAHHGGSKTDLSASRIMLEDGRSLLDCQRQALKLEQAKAEEQEKGPVILDESDECCGLCGECGQLICCDHCPATYHLHCMLLKSLPDGDWYCPKCRCPACGINQFDGRDGDPLFCMQCERTYHTSCLNDDGISHDGNQFCSEQCKQIFCALRRLVGISHPMEGGYTWTLLRSVEEDDEPDEETLVQHSSKLALALSVMQECFSPMIDPRRKIDIIAHILKNRESEVKRLDFRGFYTFLLLNKDELITVAAVRVHGTNIAEMPLIGTRLRYRRKGMCRKLVVVIEQVLRSLGVDTLVLPAVPELLDTWTSKFGYQKVTPWQLVRLLEFTLVGFPGTKVLHKPLTWLNLCRKLAPPLAERPWSPGTMLEMGIDPEPHRKPKQHKVPPVKAEEILKDVEAPRFQPLPLPLPPPQEEVPPLRDSTEDSHVIYTRTRSNRLVKASKRFVEGLNTLKYKVKKVENPEDTTDAAENMKEVSLLKLGSSQIVIDNSELTSDVEPPVASYDNNEAYTHTYTHEEQQQNESSMTVVVPNHVEPLTEIVPRPTHTGVHTASVNTGGVHAANVGTKERTNTSGFHAANVGTKERTKESTRKKATDKRCGRCGTDDTPMWRKAPGKTLLCNACGIRLRKQVGRQLVRLEEGGH